MKDAKSSSTILKIEGMHCASCQRPIEKALRETTGVHDISVNLVNREVSVESSVSNNTLIAAVANAGFEAVIDPVQSLEKDDEANQEKFHRLMRKSMLALGIGVLLMIFGMYAPVPGNDWNIFNVAWLLTPMVTGAVL